MFRTVPLLIIRRFSLYTQQWIMSYKCADSLRGNCQQNCIIIFINCNWIVTRWQWLFYMCTKYEIGC